MPLRDTHCPACGDPILRTHHCRASRALDPPTPLNRAEFDRIREQARLEQLAGESTLHTPRVEQLSLVEPPSYVPNDHPSNRGGRP